MKKQRVISAAIAAALSSIAFQASADSSWLGSTSIDWNTPGNWNNGLPGGNAIINAQPNAVPNVATILSNISVTPVDILVGDGGGPGRLDQRAGNAQTGSNNWMYVGTHGGTGTYNFADTSTTGGTLTGYGKGTGNMTVGGTDDTQTGGRLYVGGVSFGAQGGVGVVNVNTDGLLKIRNDLSLGSAGGTGTFNLDAGTVTTGGWNFYGHDDNGSGGTGHYKQSGGTLTNSGRTYIGLGATTGTFDMTGGIYNNTGDNFRIGENNASVTTAVATISGGTLNTNRLTIGGNGDQPGQGTMNVNNANALVQDTGEIWVGQRSGSHGILNLSAGKVTSSNWIAIGRDSANGVVNLSGTGILEKTGSANTKIVIGSVDGTGTVNQTGGTMKTAGFGDIAIGEGGVTGGGGTGNGTWDISAGTGLADAVRVGWNGGSGAGNFLKVSGTGLVQAMDMINAEKGTATVNQSGGSVVLSNNLIVQSAANITGTYNLSGGTLSVDGTINDSQGVFTFTGGRITRSNAGTINYTGSLTVGNKQAGFKLDNNKLIAVSGVLDVSQGVTFDLTGDVIPANATNAPVTGSIALGTDGAITGTFDPSTTTIQGLSNLAGATFVSETVGENGLYDSNTAKIFWVQENGGALSLNYSIAPAPVPEPASVGLLMLAGAGVLARRRRK